MHTDNAESLVYARIDHAEQVLAGTLCLMSAFVNGGGCLTLAQKVIHNLTVLSKRTDLSDEFKNVCLNLRAHWCNECARACATQARVQAQAGAAPALTQTPADGGQTLH